MGFLVTRLKGRSGSCGRGVLVWEGGGRKERRTIIEFATEISLGGYLEGVATRAVAIHEDVAVVVFFESEEGAGFAAGGACGPG